MKAPSIKRFLWSRPAPHGFSLEQLRKVHVEMQELLPVAKELAVRYWESKHNDVNALVTVSDDFVQHFFASFDNQSATTSGTPHSHVTRLWSVIFVFEKLEHFERKGEVCFGLNSAEKVSEMLWLQRVKQFLVQKTICLSDKERMILLESLKDILMHGHESKHWNLYAPLFSMQRSVTDNTDSLLIKYINQCNCIPEHEVDKLLIAAWVTRYKIPFHHITQDMSDQFKCMIEFAAAKRTHGDLMDAVTVDSESTLDYDDAITIIHVDEKEVKVAVHISAVSLFFMTPYSETQQVQIDGLLKQALQRTSTIYFPHLKIPMLPFDLSHSLLSLCEQKEHIVVSYFFTFNRINGDVKLDHIAPLNTIRVVTNLTYQQVDNEMFDGNWQALYEVCSTSAAKRAQKSGKQGDKPKKELSITMGDEGSVSVKASGRRTLRSTLIISELSMLTNSHCAKYFIQHNLTGLFRTLVNDSDVLIGGQPKPFCNSMNTEYYFTITSPIRRAVDLINQLELITFTTEPLLVNNWKAIAGDLDMLVKHIEARTNVVRELEVQVNLYLICKWLKDRLEHKEEVLLEGTVITVSRDGNLLSMRVSSLEDFCITVHILNKIPKHGVRNVKIKLVDASPASLGLLGNCEHFTMLNES